MIDHFSVWRMMAVGMNGLLVTALLCAVAAVRASDPPARKEITDLPGLNYDVGFKHYSGYVKASPTRYFHYWFAEAQKDPAVSPLVVWLNGGPGCSSLEGMLEELGPYVVMDDGQTLRPNPYSWNRNANLVVFESPAGVGYSYATDFDESAEDEQVADDNYQALKQFLTIFHEFRNVEVYITGESYAGVYLPMLAARIIDGQDQFPIQFKGMAIGNGLVNKALNTDTLMMFSYWHGFIDDSLWESLVTTCCGGDAYNCQWHAANSTYCQHYVDVNNLQVWLGGLNTYDYLRYCKNPGSLTGMGDDTRFLNDLLGLADQAVVDQATGTEKITIDPNKLDHETIEKLVDVASPCLNNTAITNYLRQPSVRQALGIPSYALEFQMCSSAVGKSYRKTALDQSANVRKAVQNGVRVLLYYGDTDMACNHLLGQKFAESLSLPKLEQKRPWYYNKQIEGFVTRYTGLDYLSVKGVGHMVPQWKREQAFYMISQFLNDKPY